MTVDIDALFDRYDDGSLNRRQLLGALASLALAPRPAAAAEPTIAAVKQLNHATLFVRDVAKSQQFYQRLFGLPVLTLQPPGVNLAAGGGFIGLYPAGADDKPGIDHVCFGIERFDADAVKQKLAADGIQAGIRLRGETKELYFTDPDGIRIQLQDTSYVGGVGPLGARKP